MKKTNHLRSGLSNARGLGSAKDGTHHWWMQRLTAIALVVFFVWFIPCMLSQAIHSDGENLRTWLSSPVNATAMALMLAVLFYHTKLGLQVVIEDYVSCPIAKTTLLIANSFFCCFMAVLGVISVIKIHI